MFNFFSDIFNHQNQMVGSDVGIVAIKNGIRCTEADKVRKDFALAPVLNAGSQLPVGKRTGSAFAKLNVGLRI